MDCDPDSNPDSGPGARVNAAYGSGLYGILIVIMIPISGGSKF